MAGLACLDFPAIELPSALNTGVPLQGSLELALIVICYATTGWILKVGINKQKNRIIDVQCDDF